MAQELLLELGFDALPGPLLSEGLQRLPQLMRQELAALRLTCEAISATGSARRMALRVSGLPALQPELDAEVLGPPARVALDAAERPTAAAARFAERVGVPLSALYVTHTAHGPVLAARCRGPGLPTRQLLPAALQRVCEAFARPAVFSHASRPAARTLPLVWLVALLDAEVLPCSFQGVAASARSYVKGATALPLAHASHYALELAAQHVLLEPAQRAARITQAAQACASHHGAEAVCTNSLLQRCALRLEAPTVSVLPFAAHWLELPASLLRQLSELELLSFVVAREGVLLPLLLQVHEQDHAPLFSSEMLEQKLREVHQIYSADCALSLAGLQGALHTPWYGQLGTQADKQTRVQQLALHLAGELNFSAEQTHTLQQAAALCQTYCGLRCVKRFPTLRGELMGHWAAAQGAAPAVVQTLALGFGSAGGSAGERGPEHGSEQALSAALALADHLDTLVAGCSVNLMPAAHLDVLGMRAAARGVLKQLMEQRWPLLLSRLAQQAYLALQAQGLPLQVPQAETLHKLSGFMRHRLRTLLSESYPAEEVQSVLTQEADCPARAVAAVQQRVLALANQGQAAPVAPQFAP